MSSPAKRADPRVGLTVPEITLNSVVLPAPLGPTRPRISPAATDSETSSSARKPPNATPIASSSSMSGAQAEPMPQATQQQRHQSVGTAQNHQNQQRTEH